MLPTASHRVLIIVVLLTMNQQGFLILDRSSLNFLMTTSDRMNVIDSVLEKRSLMIILRASSTKNIDIFIQKTNSNLRQIQYIAKERSDFG